MGLYDDFCIMVVGWCYGLWDIWLVYVFGCGGYGGLLAESGSCAGLDWGDWRRCVGGELLDENVRCRCLYRYSFMSDF